MLYAFQLHCCITVRKITILIKQVMALVAAMSLNTRSACKLSVISAVQVQSMKGGT